MLRESAKFSSYNYRTYAIRRVKDAFRENRNITDPAKREELAQFGRENLEIIKRQASINRMYKNQRLVIEEQLKEPSAKSSSNLFDI